MGPTSERPLPAGTAVGKAVRKVTNGQATDAPSRSNRAQGMNHKAASRELRMRDREPARTEFAAAPQYEVEVEHSRPPSASWPAAEFALNGLQVGKHFRGLQVALHQRHGIGEIATRSSMGSVEHDR